MDQNFISSMNQMKSSLDTYWLRNTLISNNIANVNTPGYKRVDVDFSKTLKEVTTLNLNKTDKKHMDTIEKNVINGIIITDDSTSQRQDENNVDIEKEMAYLAQNTISYISLLQQINSEYSRIKLSINGGRG